MTMSHGAGARSAEELEAAWAERVRANREQVDRFREVPDADFYAPVSSLFVADPRRTSEPALEALRAMAAPTETWLDVGAGAGRYALPLALATREVVAVEPSASMRHALRTGMSEHGITNIRVVAGAWPEILPQLDPPVADTALIAHVGYDIEEIGPFIDALERASRHRCVAMLTDRSPASVADPFWPAVHGESRVPLPALPELLELLRARGRTTELRRVDRAARTFDSRDALGTFLRRQLWVAEGGPKDREFRRALASLAIERDGGWTLASPPAGSVGIVTWEPGRA
ncbi:MAG: methyltransferase domain-containing protein [Chloroflexota bacterium]